MNNKVIGVDNNFEDVNPKAAWNREIPNPKPIKNTNKCLSPTLVNRM